MASLVSKVALRTNSNALLRLLFIGTSPAVTHAVDTAIISEWGLDMSDSQGPTAVSLDELPASVQESARARKNLLIEAHIQLYDLNPGRCEVSFKVPLTSGLLAMAAGEPRVELVGQIADGVLSAVSEAIKILVLSTGTLEKSGPIRAAQPPPALELYMYLQGLRHQDAEVELAMPNPKLFQELTAAGSTLESVMSSATGVIDREVRKTLGAEIASGRLFS